MTMPADRREIRSSAGAALFLLLSALLIACSPALDWRESRPEGSGATIFFPCRPTHLERNVRVAAATLRMQLNSCKAAGLTFSLAVTEVSDPGQVTPLLVALREHAVANVDGTATTKALPTIPGATPNPESRFVRIDGRYPGGRRVVEHAAFFVKGLKLYQATVIGDGEPPGGDLLESFFGAIRL